jgi:uncharacterized coiled-coil DUF342 family protein
MNDPLSSEPHDVDNTGDCLPECWCKRTSNPLAGLDKADWDNVLALIGDQKAEIERLTALESVQRSIERNTAYEQDIERLSMEVVQLQRERLNWLNQQPQIERLTKERDEYKRQADGYYDEAYKYIQESKQLHAALERMIDAHGRRCR